MDTSPQHNEAGSLLASNLADVLSADPSVRAIELAFLHRLSVAAQSASAARLGRARTQDSSLSAALSLMQSPVFGQLAGELEQSVPDDATFGRFRDFP